MAYDEGLAQIFRDDLSDLPLVQKRMFGGLCFLVNGNMVAGVYPGGGMVRIARADRAAALAVPGAEEIRMGARVMAGMVGLPPALMADDTRRGQLLALARAYVASLPAK
ncbi:MAG: TfoX/Sxy family protein [Defluviimonas sp.]|uniref:TfoX/Sxy family protein n=1 Tax=Albidovulum sp. TaxID=1872424 RepID=UPI001DD3ADCA|nr:TfoX/Sxy family protein [Paracoccaceae bacterium]MCC0064174.1 TfoX/Sxy family protein [Defluviimonas sp.]